MKTERKHAMGEGGYCICPKCEKKMAHQQGIPCQDLKCPDCAVKMLREGSYHHDLFVMKRKKNTEERKH